MRDALRAEWTKLRTTPGPAWLLLGAVVLTVGISTVVLAAARYPVPGPQSGFDPVKLSLTGVQLGQAAVAVLAVLTVAGEYGSGMIRVTLAAVPRRGRVLAAKAVLVGALTLGCGAVAAAGCVLAARILLPGRGFTAAHGFPPPSLLDGPTLRAAFGSALYLTLVALLGLGLAAALRDSAASIGAALGLLYLFPILAGIVANPHWHRRLDQIGPMNAGLAVQATRDLADQPIGPWAGLGVLAAWAAGALVLGSLVLYRRDA